MRTEEMLGAADGRADSLDRAWLASSTAAFGANRDQGKNTLDLLAGMALA
jgi:hypothetical protein